MRERGLTEIEVRGLLHDSNEWFPSSVDGRWIIIGRYRGQLWRIVAEPDLERARVIVVTVYPREG